MNTTKLVLTAALACATIGPVPAARAAPPSATHAAAQVEARAVDALVGMSAYLRSIPAFQVTLHTQRDDVDSYGQLITLSGGGLYSVRRPNGFAITVNHPGQSAQYVYDGKTVTIYDVTRGLYSSNAAPATIRETLVMMQQRFNAEVPLDDLFTWTEGDSRAKAFTAAHYIGKSQIAGQTTSHYAYRQAGVDWQIWIADGTQPTPLRVAIVSSGDSARPQFRADLAWNLAPRFGPNPFKFTPPANASAVVASR